MKYTILGFNQEESLKLKLDLKDLLILRWFLDFRPKMKKEIIDNKEYCWINYSYLIKDIPIIGISDKRALAKRLDKLCDLKLFRKMVKKSKLGTYTLFDTEENLSNLICSNDLNEQLAQGFECISTRQSNLMGTRLENTPKDKSTNNKSTNNTYIENNNHLSIPNLEEIRNYVKEKNLNVVPEDFFNFFEATNWVDSRGNKVKSWKQKLLTWNKFSFKNNNATKLIQADEDRYAKLREVTVGNYIPGSLTRDECMKLAFKFDVDNCSFWSSEATKVFNGEYRKG